VANITKNNLNTQCCCWWH